MFYILILLCTSFASSTKSIIDVLSSDTRFSTVLTILRDSHIIPLINSLENATFLALTNDRIPSSIHQLDRNKLEELMRYHTINHTVSLKSLHAATETLFKTCLFNTLNTGNQTVQMVNAFKNKDYYFKDRRVIKSHKADNGIIHEVENLLIPPSDILETLKESPFLKHFYRIAQLDSYYSETLKTGGPYTMFVWSDETIEKNFNNVELEYLTKSAANADRDLFIKSSIVSLPNSKLIYSQSVTKEGTAVRNKNNLELLVTKDKNGKLFVNGEETLVSDILASNGVIHVIKAKSTLPGIKFDALKYIIGLNALKFAQEINNSYVKHYLNDGFNPHTILLPPDEVIRGSEFPLATPEETSLLLRYHILKGRLNLKTLSKSPLITTVLDTNLTNYNGQKIKTLTINGRIFFNDNVFVLKDAIQINNLNIILISSIIQPPREIIDYIYSDSSFSVFSQLLRASKLEDSFKTQKGATFFIPIDKSFGSESQLILKRFLLLRSSYPVLKEFIKLCVVPNSMIYSEDITKYKRKDLQTLAENISLNNKNNQTFVVTKSHWEPFPRITKTDNFVLNGVIHQTFGMASPFSVRRSLTYSKLLEGIDSKIFRQMIKMSKLDKWLDLEKSSLKGIVVPSDKALQALNVTNIMLNSHLLKQTVLMHFIKNELPGSLGEVTKDYSLSTFSSYFPSLRVLLIRKELDKPKTLDNLVVQLLNVPFYLHNWKANIMEIGHSSSGFLMLVDKAIYVEKYENSRYIWFVIAALFGVSALMFVISYHVYKRFALKRVSYEPLSDGEL